jgi:hypothetical protein
MLSVSTSSCSASAARPRFGTAGTKVYGSLPPEQRNVLRFIFLDPRVRAAQYDRESVARFVVGA